MLAGLEDFSPQNYCTLQKNTSGGQMQNTAMRTRSTHPHSDPYCTKYIIPAFGARRHQYFPLNGWAPVLWGHRSVLNKNTPSLVAFIAPDSVFTTAGVMHVKEACR